MRRLAAEHTQARRIAQHHAQTRAFSAHFSEGKRPRLRAEQKNFRWTSHENCFDKEVWDTNGSLSFENF